MNLCTSLHELTAMQWVPQSIPLLRSPLQLAPFFASEFQAVCRPAVNPGLETRDLSQSLGPAVRRLDES